MLTLVIDDSLVVRRVLSRMLTGFGYDEIEEAPDGDMALELLKTGVTPGLVLVDWNMPGRNGLEFLIAARKLPHLVDTKILMVTTETDLNNVLDALSQGADEYLMKPFTEDALREKLELLGFEV